MIALDPWVKEFVESPHRFNWFNCSRQLGKSTGLIVRRMYRGMSRNRLQIIVSASARQAAELSKKARMIAERCGLVTPDDKMTIGEICAPKNNLRMLFLPPNPRTIRGFTGDVAWDEAAMTVEDRDVWAATFPMVTVGQGEYDICSTPRGVKNVFAKIAGKDGSEPNDLFHFHTVTIDDAVAMGGSITAADRQMLREACDDEMFREAYLCEFVGDTATATEPPASISA